MKNTTKQQTQTTAQTAKPTPKKRPRKRYARSAVLVYSTLTAILFLLLTSCSVTCKLQQPGNTSEKTFRTTDGYASDVIFYDETNTILILFYYKVCDDAHTIYIRGASWEETPHYTGTGETWGHTSEVTFKIPGDDYQFFKENYDDAVLTICTPKD